MIIFVKIYLFISCLCSHTCFFFYIFSFLYFFCLKYLSSVIAIYFSRVFFVLNFLFAVCYFCTLLVSLIFPNKSFTSTDFSVSKPWVMLPLFLKYDHVTVVLNLFFNISSAVFSIRFAFAVIHFFNFFYLLFSLIMFQNFGLY